MNSPNLLILSPPVHPIVLQISLKRGPTVFTNVTALNVVETNESAKKIAVFLSKNFSPSFLSLFLLYMSLNIPIPFQVKPTSAAMNAVIAPPSPAKIRTFGRSHTIRDAQRPIRRHFHQFIFEPSCLYPASQAMNLLSTSDSATYDSVINFAAFSSSFEMMAWTLKMMLLMNDLSASPSAFL